MAGNDFYDVQLSAAGAKLGQVRVTGTHIDYVFKPGQTTRVLTSEWRNILSRQVRNGQRVLEIAPKPAAAAPAAPAPLPASLAKMIEEAEGKADPAASETKNEAPASESSGAAKSTKGSK